MSVLNEQLEQSVGDHFFEWLNTEKGTNYTFARRAGEAPDLVYTSGAEWAAAGFKDTELSV